MKQIYDLELLKTNFAEAEEYENAALVKVVIRTLTLRLYYPDLEALLP